MFLPTGYRAIGADEGLLAMLGAAVRVAGQAVPGLVGAAGAGAAAAHAQ